MSSMSNEEFNSQVANQSKLVMQPHEWEKHLIPAPLSIAILGELVFISSKTDFSINKNPPQDGFKYIKYPDSFRSCLLQVCNSGLGAFSEAHKNMDQIRLQTMVVPEHMKTAVKIVCEGNNEAVEVPIPEELENILIIVDDCLTLAESTDKHFTDVINVIEELLEASVNADNVSGEELEELKKELEKSKLKRQLSEEAIKRYGMAMKITVEDMKTVQDLFKGAMDALPSDFHKMAKDVAEAVSENVSALVSEISNVMANTAKTLDSKSKDATVAFSQAPNPPMGLKEESQSETSVSAIALENAKFLVEQSRVQLNQTKENYGTIVECTEKNQKKLTEILVEMQNCETKEIDFKNTIQMLMSGMNAIGRMKKQWDKIVQFFQMVSDSVEISLTRTFTDYVSTPKTESLLSQDLLNSQAFQATNVASLVHVMSTNYTEVSGKYLMACVCSLEKLMTMDKDKPEFLQERLQLQNSCKVAQEGILSFVQKNMEEFEEKTNSKMEKIDKELQSIVPEATPFILKNIHIAFES